MLRIDAVCRHYEADWRAGSRPSIESYLAEVPDRARPALRAELEALECELRDEGETAGRKEPESGSDSPTTTPVEATAEPITGPGRRPAREDAAGSPCDDATIAVASSAAPQQERHATGRVRYFGDYEINHEIDRGGMGVVYKARQVSLNRAVALKMILDGQLANETDVKRFHAEAEAAANLDHPGIVPIHEVGQHDGQHYFSMGFVEGESLAHRLADGPFPPREAAELIRRVCEAIEYAHHRGVIHRDLKPANILLDRDGNPRVTDFGLAKKLESDSSLTGSGQIMGTPSYMPPEQARGNRHEIGPATDVYGLGATLYRMVTGAPPFQAGTASETVLQVLMDDPVPPRRLNPSIPADLETICLKCLEKEPSRRYASAADLGEDLRRHLDNEPIRARPAGPLERARKWARRRPAIAGLLALILLVTTFGAAGLAWERSKTMAALAEVRRYLYSQLIRGADEEFWANGSAAAEKLLDDCPAEYRGWEWNFLKRRNRAGRVTLEDRLGDIGGIEFSPDGRFIVGIDDSSCFYVWDAATGALRFQQKRPDAASIYGAGMIRFACSPDGRKVAVSRLGMGVQILDIATGKKLSEFPGSSEGEFKVGSFSKDGRAIACLIGDAKAGMIDAETGRVLRSRDIKAGLEQVVFAADGRRVAQYQGGFGGDSQSICLFDLANDDPPIVLSDHAEHVRDLAFDGEGRVLFAVDRMGALIAWNTADGRMLRRFPPHSASALAVRRDGSTVAVAEAERTIAVREVSTGRLVSALRQHEDPIAKLAFSPDGTRIVSVDKAGVGRVWDTTAAPPVRNLMTADPWIGSLCFSPDGRQVATVEGRAITRAEVKVELRIWDVESGAEIQSIQGYSEEIFSNAAYHPDGKRVALSMGPTRGDHRVHIWDLATGQAVQAIDDQGRVKDSHYSYALAFHPTGDRLATTDTIAGNLRVWDIPSGRERFTVKAHPGIVNSVAFSPDGRWVTTVADGEPTIRDASTGNSVIRLRGPADSDSLTTIAFSPDSRQVAAGGLNRTVWVWDTATGKPALSPLRHDDRVTDIGYSPDGRRIASAANDRVVKIWDASTGREVFSMKEAGCTVSFSPNGHLLATVDQGCVKIWDGTPATEAELRRSLAPAGKRQSESDEKSTAH